MKRNIIICDFAIAIMFSLLFIGALVQICMGAWWHIVSATISALMAYTMFYEARTNMEEEI